MMLSIMYVQIYVPLIDNHWYLMVVSIDECIVYKLDSFPFKGQVLFKKFHLSAMVNDSYGKAFINFTWLQADNVFLSLLVYSKSSILTNIVRSQCGHTGLLDDKPDIGKWLICELEASLTVVPGICSSFKNDVVKSVPP